MDILSSELKQINNKEEEKMLIDYLEEKYEKTTPIFVSGNRVAFVNKKLSHSANKKLSRF